MARPANADSDETRRRLVDAAIGQFARQGFHGASSRELAKEARLNVAIVNYHFRSKQGLYDAAVDEVYRRLRARGAEVLLATVSDRAIGEPSGARRGASREAVPSGVPE